MLLRPGGADGIVQWPCFTLPGWQHVRSGRRGLLIPPLAPTSEISSLASISPPSSPRPGLPASLPSPDPISPSCRAPAAAEADTLTLALLDASLMGLGPTVPSSPATPPPLAQPAPVWGPFPSLSEAFPGLVPSRRAQLSPAQTPGPLPQACPKGFLWMPVGCGNPLLGFPASSAEVRRLRSTTRLLRIRPLPPPLSLSSAVVVAMDRDHALSSDRNSNGKRATTVGEVGEPNPLDPIMLEAELRQKLQREQDARDRAAADREHWGPPPAWYIEEERRTGGLEELPPPPPVLPPRPAWQWRREPLDTRARCRLRRRGRG